MNQLINCYNPDTDIYIDGVFNKLNDFCINKKGSSKCKNFYKKILLEDDGIYQCPFGFNCVKKGKKIYNCILLKENYNNKKMKNKKGIEQKLFTNEEIEKLIKIDDENNHHINNAELLYKCMSDFLHDITKVNKMIDNYSKSISKKNMTKKDASKLESIYHLSDFITKRIELYRVTSNSEIIRTGKKRERNAYQLWDIYRHVFKDFCQERKLSISMEIYSNNGSKETNKNTKFFANDSITILPYLLIDNAVKYSKEDSVIKISFYQSNGTLTRITITSISSYQIKEDYKLFFKRGYRSINNTSKSSGSGLGLDIVKQICDYNDIEVKIDIDKNEIEEQMFTVTLDFNN